MLNITRVIAEAIGSTGIGALGLFEEEEEEPTLDLWEDDDWWIFPGEQRKESTGPRFSPPPSEVISPSAWMRKYDNGRIPAEAMAKVPGTPFLMHPGAAQALGQMLADARRDGIRLSIGNTYRSYEQQSELYRLYLSGQKSAPVAPPGESKHGWGFAVDLKNVGPTEFAWLAANAHKYGFTNPWLDNADGRSFYGNTEPWHWEWTGKTTYVQEKPEKQGREQRKRKLPLPAQTAPYLLLERGTPAALSNGVVLALPFMDGAGGRGGVEKQKGGGGVKVNAPYGTPQYWREVAHRLAIRRFGYSEEDWKKLDWIIQRESGWDPTAVNPSSGAYGIPQIMPTAHGTALKNDPLGQIFWLFRYIRDRYGSVDAAYEHKRRTGWY